ncbi:MAG: hypothetical protein EOP84_27805, partial [Verrucomicrobiaceae bacterium]
MSKVNKPFIPPAEVLIEALRGLRVRNIAPPDKKTQYVSIFHNGDRPDTQPSVSTSTVAFLWFSSASPLSAEALVDKVAEAVAARLKRHDLGFAVEMLAFATVVTSTGEDRAGVLNALLASAATYDASVYRFLDMKRSECPNVTYGRVYIGPLSEEEAIDIECLALDQDQRGQQAKSKYTGQPVVRTTLKTELWPTSGWT